MRSHSRLGCPPPLLLRGPRGAEEEPGAAVRLSSGNPTRGGRTHLRHCWTPVSGQDVASLLGLRTEGRLLEQLPVCRTGFSRPWRRDQIFPH